MYSFVVSGKWIINTDTATILSRSTSVVTTTTITATTTNTTTATYKLRATAQIPYAFWGSRCIQLFNTDKEVSYGCALLPKLFMFFQLYSLTKQLGLTKILVPL
jgi:hypothetical protein